MKRLLLVLILISTSAHASSNIQFHTRTENGNWVLFELSEHTHVEKNNSFCRIRVTATANIEGVPISCKSDKKYKLSNFASSLFNFNKCSIRTVSDASDYISKEKLHCNDKRFSIEYGSLISSQRIDL